jgi:Zn-dependent alcohol dehydrogenase
MKTKAAIAYAAGKPLEVVTVDLDGPKIGEVLIEIRERCVPHGRIYPFRRGSGGPVPGDFRA